MRQTGWESALYSRIAAARHVPFAWGSHDCAHWCAAWIKTATGVDLSAGWDAYSTEAQALNLLTTRGYSTYADLADAVLPSIPVTLAQRGDIVLHPTGALGICAGALSYFIGRDDLFTEQTNLCLRSWKV